MESDLVSELIKLQQVDRRLLDESEQRIVVTNEMVCKLVCATSSLERFCEEQISIYDKHLSRLEEAKTSANSRCDELMRQNSILLDQLIEKDKQLKSLNRRYDMLIEILQSSVSSIMGQHNSSAAITIGTDLIDKLRKI